MRKLIAAAVMFGTAGLFVPAIAHAHFNLMAPASWANQAARAIRKKAPPAVRPITGMTAVPTNMVTALRNGCHGHRDHQGDRLSSGPLPGRAVDDRNGRPARGSAGDGGGHRPVRYDDDSESAGISGARGRHAQAHRAR